MNQSEQNASGLAAFFDLDGTLLAKPSLERRFFRILRQKKLIPMRNFVLWLCEAVRLAPRGWQEIVRGNKAYLRGVRTLEPGSDEDFAEEFRVPAFFAEAVDCAAWHARQGHKIILVTGTVEPLALRAAMKLKDSLRERGCEAAVHVCATRLETQNEHWTGGIIGEAIFGEAKAREIQQLAKKFRLDLAQCWAYGDSASDRWMLESVGHPQAMNPSRKLRRIARKKCWPIASWTDDAERAERVGNPKGKNSLAQETIRPPMREVAG
jgi:HAD superfamily hydrolase (TIGR01490 family)